jgi:hypothetical protein
MEIVSEKNRMAFTLGDNILSRPVERASHSTLFGTRGNHGKTLRQ